MKTTTLNTHDNLSLFVRQWDVSEPEALCLFAHGAGEHAGRYIPLASALNKANFSVWAVDHRGHGQSQGKRGDAPCFDQLVQDFRKLTQAAQKAHPHLPMFLIGHSMGGLLSLRYATLFPEDIQAVVVSSPALGLAVEPHPLKLQLAHFLNRVAPSMTLPNGVAPKTLSRRPEVAEHYKTDPYVHSKITARFGLALRNAMHESTAWPEQIDLPCLILQAGDDQLCSAPATQTFAKQMDPSQTQFILYDGFFHELFQEPERDQIFETVIDWLKKHIVSS